MDDDRVILLETSGDDGSEAIELRASNNGTAIAAEAGDGETSYQQESRPQKESPDEPAGIVYVAACVAAVGGILFGYDMGVISGAKTQMQAELGLTCAQVAAAVAFLPLGGFVASLVGGIAVDKYGRRFTIAANALIFTLGSLLISLTSTLWILLLGRLILGFAVSLSAIAECIYIAEIATDGKRGMLVSLNELGITVGILVAFLVNYIFAEVEGGWRVSFGLSGGIALAQAAAVVILLPRTPQFLIISHREEEAEATIQRLRLAKNVRQKMADIRHSLQDSGSGFFMTILDNSDNLGSRFMIGCALVLFQQFSGQPNMMYFAADVFRQVGFCNDWSATLATVGLGILKVLSTGLSLSIVDRVGRRRALIAGISVMAVSVLTLSAFAFHQGQEIREETCHELTTELYANASSTNITCQDDDSSWFFKHFAFFSLVCFVCAYSFSFGPITWILLSEIFPASTKGRAMALATALNWFANTIVSATFLQATAVFSLGGVFLSYSLICILAVAFVVLLVPETKNKSLEEISKELKSKNTRGLMQENLQFCCRSRQQRPRNEAYHNYSVLHFTV